MSNIYLSFASIAKLCNNGVTTISPIGELSNKAKTYSRDPGVYVLDDETSTTLFNFLSSDGNDPIDMDSKYYTKQIQISDWIYDQAKNGNVNSNATNCLTLLQSQFSGDVIIEDIGVMVTDSTVYLPSMIHGYHVDGEDQHEFYLWFAEEYFRREYPHVDFAVVHPIPLEEFDSLMTMNNEQIIKRFSEETPDIIQDRTDALTNNGEYPYTSRDIIKFELMDVPNPPDSVLGYWRYLSWGNGDDFEDQLFTTIQDEILANSQYELADWEAKIPDLFNPVEFFAIPVFDELGITNQTNSSSTYSPITDEKSRRELIDQYVLPNMEEEHVIESLTYFPFLYKSVKVGFVAKPTNRDGFSSLRETYKDYQLIPSTSSSFDTMSPDTRQFIMDMDNLIAAAETVTPYSVVPNGIARMTKNDKLCVVITTGVIRVVMVTKWQMIDDGYLTA